MRFKNEQGRIISANPSLAEKLQKDKRYVPETEWETDSTEDYGVDEVERTEIDSDDRDSDGERSDGSD